MQISDAPPLLKQSVMFPFRSHVDDILSNGEWSPPDPNCLIPRNDRLEIFGQEILYAELAEWTKSLHDISQKLSQYKETT